MRTINERIALCMKELGLTNTAFAKRLNISQSFVSRIASGTKIPSDRTILDICREFNVNEHWLRTGEGEMFVELTMRDEIAAFMGDLLASDPDFRHKFVSMLARMTPEEWAAMEKRARELSSD